MLLAYLLLITALTISSVAIYYSVAGLAAIFAAAFWPIVIMGTTLEVAKLVAASWLKQYWDQIPRLLKWYLTVAVVILMLITSMGIFGFLSKAHLDQNIISGDSQAKLSLLDEKIRTQRDNIEIARKALQQMDAQVDARLSRGDSEQGAERAVQIRRQQAGERAKLQKDIGDAQKEIAKLNEERAPIAAENRKIEAEVGPIKYIAKLIYGDNPDTNVLEKAVTWVIILIIFVFDPLAVLMLLASQWTFAYLKQQSGTVTVEGNKEEYKDSEPEEYVQSPWPFPVADPDKIIAVAPAEPTPQEEIKDDLFPTYEEITPKEEPAEQIAKEEKGEIGQPDPYDSKITYDWDGGSSIYSKSYIQHLIKQLQEKKISINNLNKEELDEITSELEAQQTTEPNKNNNPT
jgi:low affinity Fe/Cu permease